MRDGGWGIAELHEAAHRGSADELFCMLRLQNNKCIVIRGMQLETMNDHGCRKCPTACVSLARTRKAEQTCKKRIITEGEQSELV